MNKLTKDHEKRLTELRERWDSARAELETAQNEANKQIADAVTALNAQIAAMNAIVSDANELRDEIASAAQDYMGEKSEKWQEGERGVAYQEFASAWENEVEEIEEVEAEELDRYSDTPETILSEDDYPSEPAS